MESIRILAGETGLLGLPPMGKAVPYDRTVHPRDIPDRVSGHIKNGIRGFLHNHSKSFIATAVLAMGIGMSVAMFSVIDAVVLRPLPSPNRESFEAVGLCAIIPVSQWTSGLHLWRGPS
jgi:hypothetical protein